MSGTTGRFLLFSLAVAATSFAADPLDTRFAISYQGIAPAVAVTVACNIDYLQFGAGQNNLSNNTVMPLAVRSMDPGEVHTIACLHIVDGMGPLTKGVVHVTVAYYAPGPTLREHRTFTFGTEEGPDHTIRWSPMSATQIEPFSVLLLNAD